MHIYPLQIILLANYIISEQYQKFFFFFKSPFGLMTVALQHKHRKCRTI